MEDLLSEGFEFSADTDRVDRPLVHHWLSTQAYWAMGRTREVNDAAIDGSRNFGVYRTSGEQVAYARVVTDGATFAWLCDVFVDQSVRGLGIGVALIAGTSETFEGLKRVFLATADAHGLYAKFGFEPFSEPGKWMAKIAAV